MRNGWWVMSRQSASARSPYVVREATLGVVGGIDDVSRNSVPATEGLGHA